jgi:hypothetical protein
MDTLASISQSRIIRSEPNIVLKVRVSLRLPPRRPGRADAHRHRILPDIQTGDPVEHDLHGSLRFLREATIA